MSPADPERIGADLRQVPSDAVEIDRSVASGAPILSGPVSFTRSEVFVYRQPIYVGEGPPSRERLWGFATVFIDRNAVVCPLGACAQPPKYRQALRLVVGQMPQPPFTGDAAMFDAASDAAKVAVRIPGGRIEMAAIPVEGWSAVTGMRRLIWAIAIPLALIASGKLLLVFFGLTPAVLRVSTGLVIVLVGIVLDFLRADVAAVLVTIGITSNAVVTAGLVTLIAFAIAYTINAALLAFVWPAQPAGRIDSLQQAPSILRNFVTILLYATAGLWVASYAFDLDLHGIGLTSGAAGIIVGFATQKIILDFFSGVMLGIERPFQIGDWVELKADGAGVRGVIHEMTWRTTQVRNSNLDMVTIPNSVMSQATIVNRSRPTRFTEVTIPFTVGVDVPIRHVEETAMRAIEPLLGKVLVPDRKPSLRASAIEDGDVKYRLNVYAILGPGSDGAARDAVVRALRDAFAGAGIAFSSTTATMLGLLAGTKNPKDQGDDE
ncbi:MAG: mechanosensitive ion channel domain-containing protein [Pseudolabrys sp.]